MKVKHFDYFKLVANNRIELAEKEIILRLRMDAKQLIELIS